MQCLSLKQPVFHPRLSGVSGKQTFWGYGHCPRSNTGNLATRSENIFQINQNTGRDSLYPLYCTRHPGHAGAARKIPENSQEGKKMGQGTRKGKEKPERQERRSPLSLPRDDDVFARQPGQEAESGYSQA